MSGSVKPGCDLVLSSTVKKRRPSGLRTRWASFTDFADTASPDISTTSNCASSKGSSGRLPIDRVTLPRNATAKLKTLVLDAAEAQRIRHKVKLAPYEILDDHQPFLNAGFPAVDLIDFDYGSAPGLMDYWHTPKDTVDKLSAGSLQDMALLVLEMISRL